MQKLIVFLVLFFVALSSASSQELIVVVGGGMQKTDTVSTGSYAFAQARLMFPIATNFRIGPYLGYTQYTSNDLTKTPNSALLGKEFSWGASVDNFGSLSYSYFYYWWTNFGIKQVSDEFRDGQAQFKSNTKTNSWFVSGGLMITDDWKGWFGNNRFMFEYQKPLKSQIAATLNGEAIKGLKPYNKESFRLNLESGIKRFGEKVSIEPLIHLGYGRDFGRSKNFYEIGGGVDLGVFKDWYRDIVKVKVFYRQDFASQYSAANKVPAGVICGEAVFNITSLVNALKFKK